MVQRCFALCGGNDGEKVSLFRVPSAKVEEWRKVIPRKDRILTNRDTICERHFKSEFIIREVKTPVYSYSLRHPKLSEDAVPTIFVGCPSSSKYTRKIYRAMARRHARGALESVDPEEETPNNNVGVYIKDEALDNRVAVYIKDESTDDPSEQLLDNAFFTSLWNQNVLLEVPSSSWSQNSISHDNKKLISIQEIIPIEDGTNTATRKKIILYEFSFSVYVFGQMVESSAISPKAYFDSVTDLEIALTKFDSLNVCYGALGLNRTPVNFNPRSYYKDHILGVWRHVRCPAVIKASKLNSKCYFCEKIVKVLCYYKTKLKKAKMSRKQMARLRINIARRERIINLCI